MKQLQVDENRFKHYKILITTIFVLGVLIRIIVFINLPEGLGFDENSHYAYVRFIAENWSFPKATEGTAFYHPPLFHILGAFIYLLASVLGIGDAFFIVRFISTLFGILTLPIVYLAAREIFPENKRVHVLSLAIASFLPIHSLTSGMIGNDAIVSFFVSLTVYLLLKYENEATLRNAALIGITTAFSMLSKYNGLVLLPVVFIYFTLRRKWEHLAVAALLTMSLGGWWYLKNYITYQTLVPYNWSFGSPTSHNPIINLLKLYDAAFYNFPLLHALVLKLLNLFYTTLWHWHTYYFVYEFSLPLSGYIKALLTICIATGLFYMTANFRSNPKLMVMFLLAASTLIGFLNYVLAFLAYVNYSLKYTDYHMIANARYILPMVVPLSLSTGAIIDRFFNKKGLMIASLFLSIGAVYIPFSQCNIFPEPVAQPAANTLYVEETHILPYSWGIYWVGTSKQIRNDSVPYYAHKIYNAEGAFTGLYIRDEVFSKYKWKECK